MPASSTALIYTVADKFKFPWASLSTIFQDYMRLSEISRVFTVVLGAGRCPLVGLDVELYNHGGMQR